jgi:hypothetical protein
MREKFIDTIVFLLIGAVAGLVLASLVSVTMIPKKLDNIEKALNNTERTLTHLTDSIYW